MHYPKLEAKIQQAYSSLPKATARNTLMDSYIKGFRWATDRLNPTDVIAFITNGGYFDKNATTAFRASLYKEFNHLYILNLGGNQHTSSELSREEGGKIFGSGSRTPVAISISVRDGTEQHMIYYHDIDDYLSQKEKLEIINKFGSIANIDWDILTPKENNDWLNKRDLHSNSTSISR